MFITENFRKTLNNIDSSLEPHGYVIIRDKNNKVLVDKSNMILIGGRQHIFELFLDSQKSNKMYPNKISSAIFSNEANEVSFDTLNVPFKQSNNSEVRYSFDNSTGIYQYIINMKAFAENNDNQVSFIEDNNEVGLSSDYLDGHNVLCFSFSVRGSDMGSFETENIAITALYLKLKDSVEVKLPKENTTKYADAFSKIVFDPIPLYGLDEITIDYYIYF